MIFLQVFLFIQRSLFIAFLWIISLSSAAQNYVVDRVEPPNWWCGMKSGELQLLVYGRDIGKARPAISYPGVELKGFSTLQNPNYLFIDLYISPDAGAGTMEIKLFKDQIPAGSISYKLLSRNKEHQKYKGFGNEDVIYLIMPDRFSNGDPSNDSIAGLAENVNRLNPDGRHGGDIKGIMNNLDYFSELGVTALWFNPFLENNNPKYSYHGYAISDFYKIDGRFGSNGDYLKLVDQCHSKGLKVIMDVIFNHSSIDHWFIKDLPSDDWIHSFNEYTRSNFRASTITDPHASEYDRSLMLTGWFDRHMPDLNQKNPYLANYLIQNTIWWIEYSGIDGIRIDTQPYPFKEFMTQWSKRVFEEYPELGVVGEAWMQQEATTAYFQQGDLNRDGYSSGIPSVTDFPLYFSVTAGLNENEGWTEGMSRIYNTLALDYVYPDATRNMIFLDNHDLTRFSSSIGGNMDKFMTGVVFLLTTRGIPMLYYGTEIMMQGFEHEGHGHIRKDFPGGWEGDTINVFNQNGLMQNQKAALDFVKKMLLIRKTNPVLQYGKLIHFVPSDGVYVYFRISNDATMMVVLNNRGTPLSLPAEKFKECLKGFSKAKNLLNGDLQDNIESFQIVAGKPMVLELLK